MTDRDQAIKAELTAIRDEFARELERAGDLGTRLRRAELRIEDLQQALNEAEAAIRSLKRNVAHPGA